MKGLPAHGTRLGDAARKALRCGLAAAVSPAGAAAPRGPVRRKDALLVDKQWEITSHSEEETRSLGRALGRLLRPGHLVLLEGPLGAGKTVFVQGIGQGMELDERVTSPTFTLVHHYGYGEGGTALIHADLYRLEGPGDLEDLGLDGDGEGAPVVVEWWSRAADGFPPGRLEIQLDPEGDSRRRVRCRATDAVHGELLEAWRRAWEERRAADAHSSP